MTQNVTDGDTCFHLGGTVIPREVMDAPQTGCEACGILFVGYKACPACGNANVTVKPFGEWLDLWERMVGK